MYDEVPAGTAWDAPENKAVLAVGPLTASGVPLAGRSTWATLSTFSKDYLIVDAHTITPVSPAPSCPPNESEGDSPF